MDDQGAVVVQSFGLPPWQPDILKRLGKAVQMEMLPCGLVRLHLHEDISFDAVRLNQVGVEARRQGAMLKQVAHDGLTMPQNGLLGAIHKSGDQHDRLIVLGRVHHTTMINKSNLFNKTQFPYCVTLD